jgi:uncharacterized membrane protein
MHLSRQSQKGSNGESLLGLIDAAQAIVLTLLVIEMPVLIIEIIENAGGVENLYFNLGIAVLGYFLSAVVIYDIWSIQKSLFKSTRSSFGQNLACISTLWLSTLIPPLLYIAEHFSESFVAVNIAATGETMDSNFADSDVSLVFRTVTIFTVLIIHFILFVFSRKKETWIDSSSACFNSRLLRLRVIALLLITPISLILGIIGGPGFVLIPLLMFVPFVFVKVRIPVLE